MTVQIDPIQTLIAHHMPVEHIVYGHCNRTARPSPPPPRLEAKPHWWKCRDYRRARGGRVHRVVASLGRRVPRSITASPSARRGPSGPGHAPVCAPALESMPCPGPRQPDTLVHRSDQLAGSLAHRHRWRRGDSRRQAVDGRVDLVREVADGQLESAHRSVGGDVRDGLPAEPIKDRRLSGEAWTKDPRFEAVARAIWRRWIC